VGFKVAKGGPKEYSRRQPILEWQVLLLVMKDDVFWKWFITLSYLFLLRHSEVNQTTYKLILENKIWYCKWLTPKQTRGDTISPFKVPMGSTKVVVQYHSV